MYASLLYLVGLYLFCWYFYVEFLKHIAKNAKGFLIKIIF